MGPHPELIGRRPAAVPAGEGRARLEGTETWVSGMVSGLAAGAAVAVTVDGRVVATTRVDGSGRFGAPLRSAGEVGVLEIVPGGGFRKL